MTREIEERAESHRNIRQVSGGVQSLEKLKNEESSVDYTSAASGKFSDCLFGAEKRSRSGFLVRDGSGMFMTQSNRQVFSVASVPARRTGGATYSLGASSGGEREDSDRRLARQFLQINTGAGTGEEVWGVGQSVGSMNDRPFSGESFVASITDMSLPQLWEHELRGGTFPLDRFMTHTTLHDVTDALEGVDRILAGLELSAKNELTMDVFPRTTELSHHEVLLRRIQQDISNIRPILQEFEVQVREQHIKVLEDAFCTAKDDSFIVELATTVDQQIMELEKLEQGITDCREALEKHKARLEQLETAFKLVDSVEEKKQQMRLTRKFRKIRGILCDALVILTSILVWWILRSI
ncbi:HEL069Cp [Eremothecium sinecaudum]|uniref:HEL069Cp n=1 Tax=Eremothecium sinecaudum TaxID=45286 RepID=A0A109UXE7_9SACH|nr:HEL069Cp [Eremothecium sinecaudum]AMD21211.1 HEL069Cp [Eremothecium sinecaudum]